MPILGISQQPNANQLLAAYRPTVLKVEATASNGAPMPPVVYCDVYINGQFYKTISKTVFSQFLGSATLWNFDIQDACQEFLTKVLGPNGGSDIVNAVGLMAKVFCRFRSSGIDSNGFIAQDGTAPIQGTLLTQPVAGTGSQSVDFFVVNATLQHSDSQNIANHLSSYKKRTWNASAYPLTHRPDRYRIGLGQSDYFPAAIPEDSCQASLRICFKYIGQTTIWTSTKSISDPCTAQVINLESFLNSTGNVFSASWEGSGNFTGFVYTLDGGPEILITNTSISFSGLSAGAHAFTIKAICSCGEGTLQTLNFNF